MSFALVPQEPKGRINKAGQILIEKDPTDEDWIWARNLADRWRACHAYPINTFQATLRVRLKPFGGSPIAAQRLKRMPTIIDKLKRYPTMHLTDMQDIGGVRAVLESIHDVNRLANEYRKKKGSFAHELINEKNYIRSPRSEDGYRSLHLVYRYKNRQNPSYDGLKLELQIRTKLQHTWATAVETMGTFLGQALKSRRGDQEWLDFFAVVSSAFAHIENSPLIPRYAELSCDETFKMVDNAERSLGALDKMNGISTAVNEIVSKRGPEKSWSYHLIILDSLGKNVKIISYGRDNFQIALKDYSEFETKAAQGEKIEPVLVSAGPIGTLRRAYPNFFLDIGEFVHQVRAIIGQT